MNSSIEMNDAITILKKLIDRTSEGILPWEVAENGYITTLESSLRVKISEDLSAETRGGEWHFYLIELDPRSFNLLGTIGKTADKEILHVSVEKNPSYGYSTVQEKNLADLMLNMMALARRSALNLNTGVKKALSYLDKIAG